MPEKKTIERAKKAKRAGKSASTQAGEFVREEMHHIREGKHGAKNTKQAIAIGLSKARRSGVSLSAPKKGTAKKRTRTQAQRDLAKGKKRSATSRRPSAKRSAAAKRALKRQPRAAASHRALSRHARQTPRRARTGRTAGTKRTRATSASHSRSGAHKNVSR
jgi:hypothetical protein